MVPKPIPIPVTILRRGTVARLVFFLSCSSLTKRTFLHMNTHTKDTFRLLPIFREVDGAVATEIFELPVGNELASNLTTSVRWATPNMDGLSGDP